MGQKPLDAIITRRNKVVQVALRCVACNTIVKITKFPEGSATFAMRDYIRRQNDTHPIWHFCLKDARPMHMPSGLFA